MILAYAFLRCNHPGCDASIVLREPLRYGQINPLQVKELLDAGLRAGWRAGDIDDRIEHFCPEHVPAPKSIPLPAEMASALAARMKPG